ncbi:tagaturonate reductase [Tuberibacillus sp. Marseille-P3662]|uniref:tagaturonate reductase n=1 Tax=Tuberibacillus sp. Marseille-P3662 TaxID=1965358 RepID=UPI001594B625|nr:tagaturonate reductase [Tuberibacillus sp. Marseille-P3662]
MQQLNKQVAEHHDTFLEAYPEKIVQFGEGNFLRGFIDWMIHELNKQGLFQGRIAAIQPTPHGKVVPKLNQQNGLYTLVLRGVEDHKEVFRREIISAISRGINPYNHWEEVLDLAENPSIQFVFSNTTEAGLQYTKEPFTKGEAPLSYPGKLTAFLYHRYQVTDGARDAGLTIIPCELVNDNATILKQAVLKYSNDWELPAEFIDWLETCNDFCHTLVDRIVPGYPKDEADQMEKDMGYHDALLTVGEPYHLFAIEANDRIAQSLPFQKAGLNVHWADVTPFRHLKVRILNGAHTLMYAAAYQAGKDTVLEAMEDTNLNAFIKAGIYENILPVLNMNDHEKYAFADATVQRFHNPYNRHYLLDIGLHGVSKYKTRLLPTIQTWIQDHNQLPKTICFSLASIITLYRSNQIEDHHLIGRRDDGASYTIRDNASTLNFFKEVWQDYQFGTKDISDVVNAVLANEELWDMNLTTIDGLPRAVSEYVQSILENGMVKAIHQFLNPQ